MGDKTAIRTAYSLERRKTQTIESDDDIQEKKFL